MASPKKAPAPMDLSAGDVDTIDLSAGDVDATASKPAPKANDHKISAAPNPWSLSSFTQSLVHPLNALESAAQPHMRPRDASMAEMAATDVGNVASGAAQVIRHPIDTALGMLGQGFGVRPLVEGAANEVSQAFGGKKLYQPAPLIPSTPEEGAVAIGQGLALSAVPHVPEIPGVKKGVSTILDASRNMRQTGADLSSVAAAPRRTASLASTLARTPATGDKGFIPQDVAASVAEPVRQAAANHPELVKVVTGSDPVQAYAAHQAIMREAKRTMDTEFDSVLNPVKSTPVNPSTVTQNLKASDALMTAFPQEAAWINEFYNRLDGVKTLGELNEMRRLLNERARSTYMQTPSTMEEGGKVAAARDAADTLRNYFYDELEKATGQDLKGLKRTEGDLIKAQGAVEASSPQLTKSHQIHTERRGALRTAADIAKGTKAVGGGAIPALGWAAEKMEGSQLQQVHGYLKDFYSDLPSPTAKGAPAPKAGPSATIGVTPNGPAPRGPGLPAPGAPTGLQVSPQYPGTPGSVVQPTENGLGAPAPQPMIQGGTRGALNAPAPAPFAQTPPVNAATASMQVEPTNLEAAKARANQLAGQVTGRGFVVKDGVATPVPRGELPGKAPKPKKGPAPKKVAENPTKPLDFEQPAPETKTPAQQSDAWAQGERPPAPKVDAATGERLTEMNVADISQDPERFQYKGGTDETGVTDKLKDVPWDKDLSGVISVWKDPADGKTYVVNGHHRIQKAIESKVGKIDVKHIEAKDAAEARYKGALQNIAEGNGTALDAAKFFRESGLGPEKLKKKGISLSKGLSAKGLSLSRLSDDLFNQVVSGRMDEDRGAAIGKATDDPIRQESLVKMIRDEESKGKTVSADVIDQLGRMAKESPIYKEQVFDLFGEHTEERSLMLEKARLIDSIRKDISGEKTLFQGLASKAKAERLGKVEGQNVTHEANAEIAKTAKEHLALYEKEWGRTGNINDILDNAATKIAEGGDENAITASAAEAVRKALSKILP